MRALALLLALLTAASARGDPGYRVRGLGDGGDLFEGRLRVEGHRWSGSLGPRSVEGDAEGGEGRLRVDLGEGGVLEILGAGETSFAGRWRIGDQESVLAGLREDAPESPGLRWLEDVEPLLGDLWYSSESDAPVLGLALGPVPVGLADALADGADRPVESTTLERFLGDRIHHRPDETLAEHADTERWIALAAKFEEIREVRVTRLGGPFAARSGGEIFGLIWYVVEGRTAEGDRVAIVTFSVET